MSAALSITGSPRNTNTHAAPALLLSPGPPTTAALASGANATDVPWPVEPSPPEPISRSPNGLHTPPVRVIVNAAPAPGAPTRAVLPSPATDTDDPYWIGPAELPLVSFAPCCDHAPPLRVYIHTAPAEALSSGPPTSAVLPSADSATDCPSCPAPTAPVPTSFEPCWVHTVPLRVYTHAAPLALLSDVPPTRAVLPSADSATELPCLAAPAAPLPTNFPRCAHVLPVRTNTHAAPVLRLSAGPPTSAVFP